MSGSIPPPRSIWADAMPEMPHAGEQYPTVWRALNRALAELRADANTYTDEGAEVLARALSDPLASESLVASVVEYEHLASGPLNEARAKIGDMSRANAPTRIAREIETLTTLADKIILARERLKLATFEIEHHEGAPTGKEIGDAGQRAWLAVKHLENLARQAGRAAPGAMGAPVRMDIRAREALAGAICRATTGQADPVAKAVFRAIWTAIDQGTEAANGPRHIPNEAAFWKKVSQNIDVNSDT